MIAIKDMEMPKNCLDCPVRNYSNDEGNRCDLTGLYNREDCCPLVEIVTCKDCKHRDKVHSSWLSNKKDEVYFCTLQSDEYCYEVEDDHYCADGERKD